MDYDPYKGKKRKVKVHPRFFLSLLIMLLVLVALVLVIVFTAQRLGCIQGIQPAQLTPEPGTTATPGPGETPGPTDTPRPTPYAIEASKPERYNYVSFLEVDGEVLTQGAPFARKYEINFPKASDYTNLVGVITFRGDNWRTGAAHGSISIDPNNVKLKQIWMKPTRYLPRNNPEKNWTGSGWTGQPLMVQWPDKVKQTMNMHDWAKAKPLLVEVIYPTMDGYVYFFDLEDGKETRDPINVGMPFKGTGSLDPRGVPLLYLGSGDEYDNDAQKSRAMIYSLIDGTRLYEFGKQGADSFAQREFYAYDSAPLIDEKNDLLIWPGENGVLYTMKLNMQYDQVAGTVSVNPSEIVKKRYESNRSSAKIDQTAIPWLGYEGSAVIWNGCIYLSSNDGLFQCIDLGTMETKWIADTKDDTNGSPVLDVRSETEAYLYVGTSLHFTAKSDKTGRTPLFRINAMTGDITRDYPLTVHTVNGISGGIQATVALGKAGTNVEDLVFVPYARTPDKDTGILLALDKDTFERKWEFPMEYYTWSSPVLVYSQDTHPKGYVLIADSGGYLYLLDGLTGVELARIKPTKSNFEASPAVFNNIIVIGSRGQEVFGIRID
ncbi:MAG: pyrrolo-quinoline quinone [Clostridiales bacterium]|nr:pyrrolo-quinoline quinone [Clostridiales bacterium]